MNKYFSGFENFVFVSPHLDDAIFSAGHLIKQLVDAGKEVTILNVFTKATERNSLSARMFLFQTKYHSAASLFKDRKAEDKTVFSRLGLKPTNLDMIDALWRPKEEENPLSKIIVEFSLIYPLYRQNILSGKLSKNDHTNLIQLTDIISTHLKRPKTLVLGPAGIGGHVDHVLVRQAVVNSNSPYALWIDVPYNKRIGFEFKSYQKEAFHLSIKLNLEETHKKQELCQGYYSQYRNVFGQTDPELTKEEFLIFK